MGTVEPGAIGQHLLACLYQAGVGHIFGVPGDYVLGFYDLMAKGPVRHIGTTREDTAAFAADGYARCRGMGALAVTYGVGALNTVNAVAGAYAESSPVVVISGAPGVREQREDPLIHHRFGPFRFQREIFERITCAAVVLDDPVIAFRQVERALAAARQHCKPVYIEIPADRVMAPGYPIPQETPETPSSDDSALAEAVAEAAELLGRAVSPVILAGVELHRRGLQDALVGLVEQARLPVAATLTGKSVFAERHPAYLGVYEGAMSTENARYMVEQSDLLLMLGVTLNDVDTGIYTARLDPQRIVRAAQNEVVIRHHRYPRVLLADFVTALARSVKARGEAFPMPAGPEPWDFPAPDRPMTIARLVERLDRALTSDMIVVCDVGDCLFAATDLRVHERSEFLASAFYTSMGFAVPAALGAQIARPDHRALILVGDGAFQMTGTELSTHARLGLAPIVVVLDNRGYSTERFILDGAFNDIADWRFHRLGEVFGPLQGYDAPDEAAFENALSEALVNRNMPSLINVRLSPGDASIAMKRLAGHLQCRVKGEG
ncbi:decarboxylase, thiamine pyrophosphate enzyme family [Methylococcus capsulatus str. Bath]|uniref:pyruvate decarboxylase n=1 Tax=Methylococcus capsulatus (strain ATCC 33009 / NCIMB 11132 / Bath) TaxID=243233 RepID=Q60A74_METCA|nr:thiamine pyrophosphate-binding protein [Methylococcus capsulatus]AAU92943.1 decarboxylase, thiamine pyrophosphate enzyme family [Methylococcus capsulatus str. Bath]